MAELQKVVVGKVRLREAVTYFSDGSAKHQSLREEGCCFVEPPDRDNLQGSKLDQRRAAVLKAYRHKDRKLEPTVMASFNATASNHASGSANISVSTSPATTIKRPPKRTRPRGRSPNGKRWDGWGWVDCEMAAARHAARDAKNKATREVEGRSGPGRPLLAPREPNAETKGIADSAAIKEKTHAVLSNFMRHHEALTIQQPEQSARAALRSEEPDDVSAQQVRVFGAWLLCLLAHKAFTYSQAHTFSVIDQAARALPRQRHRTSMQAVQSATSADRLPLAAPCLL